MSDPMKHDHPRWLRAMALTSGISVSYSDAEPVVLNGRPVEIAVREAGGHAARITVTPTGSARRWIEDGCGSARTAEDGNLRDLLGRIMRNEPVPDDGR